MTRNEELQEFINNLINEQTYANVYITFGGLSVSITDMYNNSITITENNVYIRHGLTLKTAPDGLGTDEHFNLNLEAPVSKVILTDNVKMIRIKCAEFVKEKALYFKDLYELLEKA